MAPSISSGVAVSGIVQATTKASVSADAPNRPAIVRSRTKPRSEPRIERIPDQARGSQQPTFLLPQRGRDRGLWGGGRAR